MKILTPTKLASKLDKSLSWRKKELTQIKLLSELPSTQAQVVLRAGITLMYAHWEGFVKESSIAYLRYLSTQKVCLSDLRSCFLAIALKSDLQQLGQAKKHSLHTSLVDRIRKIDSVRGSDGKIPFRQVISTRSNLKSAVLREIASTLGIDYAPFELKERTIIDRLVKFRNLIAHGQGIAIEKNEYDQLHVEIIALMDAFKESIQDSAFDSRHVLSAASP